MDIKRITLFLIVIFIFTSLLNFFFVLQFSSVFLTGYSSAGGSMNVTISTGDSNVTIFSPLNITYFLSPGNLFLDLNVSANFPAVAWKYYRFDENGTVYIHSFVPNSTIPVNGSDNKLTVYAQTAGGIWYGAEVFFYVNTSGNNTAPILGPIDNEIFVCEGKALNYSFNATDAECDVLTEDISPKNPFYTSFLGTVGCNVSLFRIFSGTLTKADVGMHQETVSVSDGEFVDTKQTNITVIEINNAPVMENLGAQTVWTVGANSTFYHQMNVSDIEDGDTNSGNFTFNLTWQSGANLFDINKTTGVMNYTAVPGQEGLYNLTVCVVDNNLTNAHPNISLCAPDDANNKTVCDDFTLTVTNVNRPPEIINYTPTSSPSGDGSQTFLFNATCWDPDGTIPDLYWYVDGVLKRHVDGNVSDLLSYNFGCSATGMHSVTVVASDGLLNDSQSWNVDVKTCSSSGGGGGSSGGCREEWVCDDWGECENVRDSFNAGRLSMINYSDIKELCSQLGMDDSSCGFQKRICHDLNECHNYPYKVVKPSESQICFGRGRATCNDRIKNCHDGKCEILVDCGGPCRPCPTCSDGIKNQGEEGIDCGGPCHKKCEVEYPERRWFSLIWMLLLLLLILLLIYIVYRWMQIQEHKEEDEKMREKQKGKKGDVNKQKKLTKKENKTKKTIKKKTKKRHH